MIVVIITLQCAQNTVKKVKSTSVVPTGTNNSGKMDQTEYDPWYCFRNTESIDNFISQTNENYQLMFMGFDLQIKFLLSKITQLENEIQTLKK